MSLPIILQFAQTEDELESFFNSLMNECALIEEMLVEKIEGGYIIGK